MVLENVMASAQMVEKFLARRRAKGKKEKLNPVSRN